MSDHPHHDTSRARHSVPDAREVHGTAGDPAFRIRPSLPDFRRRAPPLRMDERTRLMHRIAWLDAALSAAKGRLSTARKRVALSACAEILDTAGHDDRQFIAQAIHCLMRKHGLEPESPTGNGTPDP